MRLRSLLFVPASRRDRFDKAMASGADAVIFDLEDGVEAARKPEAREIAAQYLAQLERDTSRPRVLLRVNGVDTGWFANDLALVKRLPSLDGVVLPKCESASSVAVAAAAVASGAVLPLIETARGVLQAAAIAAADAKVAAVLFGAEDLTAEIGVPRTVTGEELLFARSQIALAATAAGNAAIDAVFIHLTHLDDLRVDARRARALGFSGKMAIHPAQVPVINDVFTPSAEEIARAQKIVDAFAAATAGGEGVVRIDDQMVDMPVVRRARRLLDA